MEAEPLKAQLTGAIAELKDGDGWLEKGSTERLRKRPNLCSKGEKDGGIGYGAELLD